MQLTLCYVHTVHCVMNFAVVALYPSVQMAILITTYSQLLCYASDTVLRTHYTALCVGIYAIIYCPVIFSANGYSDYYAGRIHSCCAMQLTLCLCTHYTLCVMNFAFVFCPVSFSANNYSDYYVFTVWCDATDTVLRTYNSLLCVMIYAIIYCPVSFSANGYSDYYAVHIHSCRVMQLTPCLCTLYTLYVL
jgi:hypothetical protein